MTDSHKRLRVLILDDGRQCLPFMRALKRAGHHVTVACGSRLSTGYFSRHADRRLLWPDYFKDPGGFTQRLLAYVRRCQPDVTLSVGDISAAIVSRNRQELIRYTGVATPEWDVFDYADDKGKTMAFCMENDIPCPKTFCVGPDGVDGIIEKLTFPVMVKPSRGIGAVGLHRIDTPEELRRHYGALHGKHGELVIQEFIPLEGGTQYQAEAFLDSDSRMRACTVISKPRFFPVTGGTSTANMTIDRPDIQESTRRLLEGIRWSGAADVDFILDPRDNVPKVLEINPRVTAGIKIGFAAGIDYADLHLRLATGQPVPSITSYKLGVYSRNLCMDILWYLFSTKADRRSTPLPFFKFFGKDVCYQTFGLDDPLPLLGFVLGMLRKYASPAVWKAKLGMDLR
ncbi:MAG: ATP-grasp domain-containing protein [Phycisphaerae bacterium]|nr:ATP-grasp domain-containing protein [Phycisphaerae bacterium]